MQAKAVDHLGTQSWVDRVAVNGADWHAFGKHDDAGKDEQDSSKGGVQDKDQVFGFGKFVCQHNEKEKDEEDNEKFIEHCGRVWWHFLVKKAIGETAKIWKAGKS